MSPRMHLALLCCANTTLERLFGDIDTMDGKVFVAQNGHALQYLQPQVHNNLGANKNMKGFASISDHLS